MELGGKNYGFLRIFRGETFFWIMNLGNEGNRKGKGRSDRAGGGGCSLTICGVE